MVIPDWSRKSAPKINIDFTPQSENGEPPPFSQAMARPIDRLAAAIIDVFIILTPIFLLLSSPLKRILTTHFLLGFDHRAFFVIGLIVVLALFTIIVYQTLFHYFFAATIGKRVLNLKVVPVDPELKLDLSSQLLRSSTWVLELFCLGLPWLAILSHHRRRPLHDRLGDTIVVSSGLAKIGAPPALNKLAVQSIFAIVFALVVVLLAFQLRWISEQLSSESSLASLIDKDEPACEAVSQSLGGGEEELVGLPLTLDKVQKSRLEVAMSLYAAGLVERKCLESEVDRLTSQSSAMSPLAYLANAFVHADDAEVSNDYLDEVCEMSPDSVECSMSRLVSLWSQEDWEGVEEIVKQAPAKSGYLDVWTVRHYMKQAQYLEALKSLKDLIDRKELQSFALVERVKALFNQYLYTEAEEAFLQAAQALPKEEETELSGWLCANQLQLGCEAKNSVACQRVEKHSDVNEIDFDGPTLALAQLLGLECKGEEPLDYLSFSDAVKSYHWQAFFKANLKKQKRDTDASVLLFSQVIASSEAPEILKVEALRRLAKIAKPKQLNEALRLWTEFDSKESWVKAGNILVAILSENQNSSMALKVAQKLTAHNSLSPYSSLILARLGDNLNPVRKPASQGVKRPLKDLLDSIEAEP